MSHLHTEILLKNITHEANRTGLFCTPAPVRWYEAIWGGVELSAAAPFKPHGKKVVILLNKHDNGHMTVHLTSRGDEPDYTNRLGSTPYINQALHLAVNALTR